MKNYFIYLIFFLLILGCKNIEKAPKPEHLIPEEKMVDILVDLAKIDAAINYNRKDFEEMGVEPEKFIYQKYGIDSAQLAKSNAYYIEQFKINKRMYEVVRDRLENQIAELDSLTSVKDSIRRFRKKSQILHGDSLKYPKKPSPNNVRSTNLKKFISKDSLR